MKINTIKCKYYLDTPFLLCLIRINEPTRKPAIRTGITGDKSSISHLGSRALLIGKLLLRGSTIKITSTVQMMLNIVYSTAISISAIDIGKALYCTP